ncbi:SDR family NAD(P)-dependent oxidoreductase [Aureibacillus halotolerans]|uniref:SDR family NAD(P)-dependent oxidoreductase n=1 Tax=Aureibacillus halotolerans TaxID=1508390 RepID=UPI001415088D|nr:SDR family NAD(P)-dependent oxidoreductase [Aureibacillus halotolerans]
MPKRLARPTLRVKLQRNIGLQSYALLFCTTHRLDMLRINKEIQLNIIALTELTHLFLAPMLAKNAGVILNVASMTAFQPAPFMSVYGATKAYVLSFTEALAAEYNETKVQIITLCPGGTQSAFYQRSGADHLKGKLMEPIDVVHHAFKAIEEKRHFKVVGFSNALAAKLVPILPRNLVLNTVKRIMRPTK